MPPPKDPEKLVKTVCLQCEKEFTAFKSAGRKFCSLSCSTTYSNHKSGNTINATCQFCGKLFHNRESYFKKGGGKYCSQACYHKAQHGAKRPLFGIKISKIMRSKWQDQEYREKTIDALKEKWQDPTYRNINGVNNYALSSGNRG